MSVTSGDADAPAAPAGLLRRGRELWAALAPERRLDPGALVLLAEACRAADRCERLDAILRGRNKDWLVLIDSNGGPIKVRMDGALREARQQQLALKQLLAQLGVGVRANAPAGVATPAGRSIRDELAAAREARQAATAGSGSEA